MIASSQSLLLVAAITASAGLPQLVLLAPPPLFNVFLSHTSLWTEAIERSVRL